MLNASKLVGIKRKEWVIDGKIGRNKTLYFTRKDNPKNGEDIEGVITHAYTLPETHELYDADLIVGNEYIVMLSEPNSSGRSTIEAIVTKDFKPVNVIVKPQNCG